ncbi:allantoinase AllB [bacterium (Candidatus Blackallbacteria) CG17_big_fil_post_rev_8_21_14_2_50_48_46]|uniref:allantoinase n=1 Tax=bacterium (Candidatus Blackallbacteria) CG17_big_fil_post_rev_8_21_14_2_50_48_46 TaxID=2014261 RepID=A0A2M7G4Y9_9BACT|nr:MAG: allantoinase AllB [bacterium (Candidatus Blackallbacteria) CG18_big_fil_WC_8_21_14_2_50_49_26]PIW17007.1 MAG: allantoinase AllB [bacterium (Candidatus Blackallbacteria) CG17_big_fil_post_rev_8_21_14_2_50_48_46]PIW48185.1 MAG: allantoinase AllB [bacterium (Candidatus Blackallbacteria) CG13_big_fil_rev_8_21_14_2_50_49_14]
MTALSLYSERVILPTGEQAATLHIADGKISGIELGTCTPTAENLGSAVMMPGLVDPHVHVNEPGRTEWEGFWTATRAAAAGGVTTLVDMPLNSDPVTTSVEAFALKRQVAQNQAWIDIGFWGGVVPNNQNELVAMINDGVLGFKCFLIHSGIDDFPQAQTQDLKIAMPILKQAGVPLLVHAELEGKAPVHAESQAQSYQAFLQSRPRDWEDRAIQHMVKLCRETGCPTHIVHLSSASALPDIRAAKAEGLPFSVETCPHYLYFAAETIPDGHPEYKCMPPIREQNNQEALWQALKEGLLDCIVTDHSPCIPGLKCFEAGDVLHAWGGIASLQLGLPSVWTRAQERGFSLEELAKLMSTAPADFIGQPQKGRIALGADADLVIWDPNARFKLSPEQIFFKHPVSPYLRQELRGVVKRTYLRGQLVFSEGQHAEKPQGAFLLGRK